MNKLGVYDCVHVLDDFLFVAPVPIGLCMADLAKFLEIAKTLGVPLEKTVPHTTCIIFLGLELDSLQMVIRLPEEKLRKIRDLLQEVFLLIM
jgi:hypothetical protein